MSEARLDVLAIGALARNKYWNEKAPVRQEYATATLVRAGKMVLVVDPGWPAEVLRSALFYRAGLEPRAVTHVFLTHWDSRHLAGLGLFEEAVWWAYEEELAYAEAEARDEPADLARARERVRPVPEKLAPGVDVFPTFGPSPGHTSLLVYSATETAVIAGDLVLTRDHFEHADLGEAPWDLVKARESFQEVAEIADLIVPGHDNLFVRRTGVRLG
jgi:glyoxylase-like metal-dependent hydrolase (beta-lactamase superfamily II)